MPTTKKVNLSFQERRACSCTFDHDGDDIIGSVNVDEGLVDSGSSTPQFPLFVGYGARKLSMNHHPSAKALSLENEHACPLDYLLAAHVFHLLVFRYRNSIFIILHTCAPNAAFLKWQESYRYGIC